MARDPDNLYRFVDYAEDVPNYIDLPELDPYTKPDYDLNDDKEYEHYLRDIEKVVRGSFEYQHMVGFLRENLDMNQCSFYEGVSNLASTKIRIEIHHEPLSLYDIVSIVARKRAHFGESLEVEYVDDVKQLLKDRLNDLINGPKVTMEDLPKEEGRLLYCPFKPVYAEESGK